MTEIPRLAVLTLPRVWALASRESQAFPSPLPQDRDRPSQVGIWVSELCRPTSLLVTCWNCSVEH